MFSSILVLQKELYISLFILDFLVICVCKLQLITYHSI